MKLNEDNTLFPASQLLYEIDISEEFNQVFAQFMGMCLMQLHV